VSVDKSIPYPMWVYSNSDGPDSPEIPKPVQNYDQWLCYRRKLKPDGKIDKIPTDPDINFNISKTDPNYWLPYQRAWDYVTVANHLDGVGFALSTRDPFAVIDLDKCRNPETGEIAEWAWNIIEAFNSYTEISSSGKGVHIWVYGTVRGTTRPKVEDHRIEAYSEGAFITVTGDLVEGTPGEIVNAQDVLDEWAGDTKTESGAIELNDASIPPEGITNDEIIGKLNSAGNADKFRRLMYETPDPDRLSEDDGALVGIVVFYTGGDVDRAKSVMRRSVRKRPKWDERRKGVDGEPTTWLRWEIQKAITSRDSEDFYTWGESQNPGFPSNGLGKPVGNLQQELKAVSFAQGGRPAPRRWAIKDVMPERFATTLYSDSGKAKTFLGVHMGMTVADSDQNRWLGFECITAPVVYMDFGMDENRVAPSRLRRGGWYGAGRAPKRFLVHGMCRGQR
jgi:putative DNA primase/helicase